MVQYLRVNSAPATLDTLPGRDRLLEDMLRLRAAVTASAERRLAAVRDCFPPDGAGASARNLAHYLGLREHDLRTVQVELAALGLSSLGRGESHVLANLDQVIAWLQRAADRSASAPLSLPSATPARNNGVLVRRAEALFGAPPAERQTRIMVTLPTEAGWNESLVRELVQSGMDCARINCAHDDRDTWRAMIANVRKASDSLQRECRVLMDLAGPKIRTGPLARRPMVRHLRPPRDDYGRVTGPCDVLLAPDDNAPIHGTGDTVLHVPRQALEVVGPGDRFAFVDCRGKERFIEAIGARGNGWHCHCPQSTWLSAGTELTLLHRRSDAGDDFVALGSFALPPFPADAVKIELAAGDRLRLTERALEGRPAQSDPGDAEMLVPAIISCTYPGLIRQLSPGQPVWFDDGKIGCVVESVDGVDALLRVTETGGRKVALKADKGINFPGAALPIPTLSSKDRRDLEFSARHSDMVGLSFIRSGAEVGALLDALADAGQPDLGVVLKIETAQAVKQLPDILFRITEHCSAGVMIARGDLAVEIGAVRLAEIQEEILWLCEAAHVPVIWATQVLDTLARKGLTSRPEITDAAMGVRAECVMLNKGPRIVEAVRILGEILTRMQAHQQKKFSLLRALHW